MNEEKIYKTLGITIFGSQKKKLDQMPRETYRILVQKLKDVVNDFLKEYDAENESKKSN